MMGQQPTAELPVNCNELGDESERPCTEPDARVANDGANCESVEQRNTSVDALEDNSSASITSPLSSSVAAGLTGDRDVFLQTLWRALEAHAPPVMRRSLYRASRSTSNEAAAFERIAAIAITEMKPDTAATICAALAARTVAQSVFDADGDLGVGDSGALLAAWLEAAKAVAAVRGCDGLLRLMPTARKLAHRVAEDGEAATDIAAMVRRVAARIVADSFPSKVIDGPSARGGHERIRGETPNSPNRIVI
jgi:hypothetical protein